MLSDYHQKLTVDGVEVQFVSSVWDKFRFIKHTFTYRNTGDPFIIEMPFVHEEHEYSTREGVILTAPMPNKTISIPTMAQTSAFSFLEHNSADICESLLKAAFDHYNLERGTIDVEYMPKLSSYEKLKGYMELTRIYVLPNSAEGISFVGFYFQCTWDDDHGIGFLTHKTRVLQIGGIEKASDLSYN